MRIFDPTKHGASAHTFRGFGPLRRFDHHEPHADGSPRDDPIRGIWYGAPTLAGCLVEVFGDAGIIEPSDKLVAVADIVRDLVLLDLRGRGAMRAGSVAALCKTADVAISQAWSRHFYETPEYREVDGLIYFNAHNDDEAVALYERARGALRCPKNRTLELDDNAFRTRIFEVADLNNLDVSPY